LSASARPTAAILITGSELLLGLVADRNTVFLARALDRLGIDLQRVLVVGDSENEIVDGLHGLQGHDLIVTSGGLGPTHDDRTVAAVAAASGRSVSVDPVLRKKIAAIMDAFARQRGIPPEDYQDGVDKQALVPDGAQVIDPIGTAPGLIVPWEASSVVVLPGPPSELANMWPSFEAHPALGLLRGGERLERSLLRVFSVSESVVARAFEDAGGDADGTTTTICARRSEVEILVRAPASSREARLRLADGMRARLAADVFSEDERPLEELVLDAARARGATIATAESCTAGLLAGRLTELPGSSAYVAGGVVVYSDAAKTALAGVDPELIATHGAVSPEVALALAEGALARLGADVGVGITGIAGPGGGTPDKPVGLVCFSVAARDGRRLGLREQIPGGRADVRDRSTTVALHLVRRLLAGAGDRAPA
jgi:nicotinamide-nucleotide amidase